MLVFDERTMVFHNGEPSIGDTIRVVKHPSRFEIATMPDRGMVVTQTQPKRKLGALLFVYIYIMREYFQEESESRKAKERGEMGETLHSLETFDWPDRMKCYQGYLTRWKLAQIMRGFE